MAKSRTKLESKFQNEVMRYLKERGGYWINMCASSFQSAGEPDIIGCYKGKFYAFELKRSEKEKPSALQNFKINEIVENGGISMKIFNLNQLKELFSSGE